MKNEQSELNELNTKKDYKKMLAVVIVIVIITIILVVNSLTKVNIDLPNFTTNLSIGSNSKIKDYLITSDENNRIQLKFNVDVPLNSYTFCYVLDTNKKAVKDSYCILPLNTELGVIDVPKGNDYIISLYSPLVSEVTEEYHIDMEYIAKHKKADLTATVLNEEELKKTHKAVIDDYIKINELGLLQELLNEKIKKEELVAERDNLKKEALKYKGKDELNYDSTITKLYEKEEELKAHLKYIEKKYKYIIKVLTINPKLYTQADNNYEYITKEYRERNMRK